jgi:hypothetical protein
MGENSEFLELYAFLESKDRANIVDDCERNTAVGQSVIGPLGWLERVRLRRCYPKIVLALEF